MPHRFGETLSIHGLVFYEFFFTYFEGKSKFEFSVGSTTNSKTSTKLEKSHDTLVPPNVLNTLLLFLGLEAHPKELRPSSKAFHFVKTPPSI